MKVNPKELIRFYRNNGRNISLTSNHFGIHKSTLYRWLKRARYYEGWKKEIKYNTQTLSPKSTARKTFNYKLSLTDQLAVKALRRSKGYDAARIKYKLGLAASVSTVHRFLKRKGLVRQSVKHRRPRFQDTIHMHAKNVPTIGYLQMDVKYITPELSGLPWTCYEYAVIDIYSRYKEAVILNQIDQDGSIVALLEVLPKLPFKPVFLQTDNGVEFNTRFKKHVEGLGLKYHYIHKQSPNENALIERSFRTDEEEFFFRLEKRPRDYDELRGMFARWLEEYNTERPHYGINFLTPAKVVANVMTG